MFRNAGTAEDMVASANPLFETSAASNHSLGRQLQTTESPHYFRFGKYRTPVSPEKSASMVQTVAPYCFAVA